MLDIIPRPTGELAFSGRFDASQVEKAKGFILGLKESQTLDFEGLEYISSAGLGLLLAAQKELGQTGHCLRMVNVRSYIRDIFHYSGFDQIFEIA